jgi:predicted nuclease with TOPRIM domain
MTYNLDMEFKKIQFAFERVKKDLNTLKKENLLLREELDYLKEKVNSNRKIISENKENIDNIDSKTIIGHRNSKKFHYGDCPYGKKITVENRVFFKDVNEAIRNNFTPCVCVKERY